MEVLHEVQPLSYKKRRRTFFFLLSLFIVSLPFLYLYATGYRFDLGNSDLIGTGGIYVAAERTGAQIYIDDELVRETRVFRTAFYAQNLEPRTHRVHVQKEGHHTWVKELPVTSHRVTEAQAFNFPLVPQVRVISQWMSATGTAVVRTPLPYASTTNEVLATTTKATSTLIANPEYLAIIKNFTGTTTVITDVSLIQRVQDEIVGTTTESVATSTREGGDVRLAREADGGVYATWVGPFERMPYYYCAKPFPRYSTTTNDVLILREEDVANDLINDNAALVTLSDEDQSEFIHPVQRAENEGACERRIRINTESAIQGFEFFPGSTDLVILELLDGIYVSEIDERAWQNRQPLLVGENFHAHVENGGIYVYDGTLIYQVIVES